MSENTIYYISALLTILVRKMIEILQGSFELHAMRYQVENYFREGYYVNNLSIN